MRKITKSTYMYVLYKRTYRYVPVRTAINQVYRIPDVQVESRLPLRGVIGRNLEAKARASHQLESRLSESPESWTGVADRARSESVRQPRPFPKPDENDALNSGRPHRFGRAKPHRFRAPARTS